MAGKATYTGDRCDGMAAALVNWLSRYASTDPSENFAEMLATFALGQLELKWVDLLTPILADAQRQP